MEHKLDTGAIRHMTVPFELKAAADGKEGFAGEFTGYAAGILNIDRTGDMILPGAFTDTLPDFLKEGIVCWQHDWATPIGQPIEAYEDDYGLMTKSRISNTTTGRDCMTLIRDGVIKKMSIGYRVQDYEWVDRAGLLSWLGSSRLDESKQISILTQFDGMGLSELFLLKKIKLFEYSPVSIPANPNAVITDAKGLPFADHSKAVVTAVRELSDRIKAIRDLRVSENPKKAANPAHIESCHSMANDMEQMCGMLREMAAAMTPQPEEEPETDSLKAARVQRLKAEFLQMQARELRAA